MEGVGGVELVMKGDALRIVHDMILIEVNLAVRDSRTMTIFDHGVAKAATVSTDLHATVCKESL